MEQNMAVDEQNNKETIPFYPDHIRTEFYVTLGVLALVLIVGIVGLYSPLGLEKQADPMDTPEHVKPEWYFLSLYQLLKYIPKNIGAVGPVIGLLILIIWPFIDHKPDKTKHAYQNRLIFSIVILIILLGLTIWGELS
jgi:quinol-cytochrome oxidoreductase complex cytochrome b subunit